MPCKRIVLGPDTVVIVCTMGDDWEERFAMACGAEQESWEEYNLKEDQEHEARLAKAHAYGDLECPWPWYADKPYEVQEPEVIG